MKLRACLYDSLVLSSEPGEKYSGSARRSRSVTSSRLNHAACEGIVVAIDIVCTARASVSHAARRRVEELQTQTFLGHRSRLERSYRLGQLFFCFVVTKWSRKFGTAPVPIQPPWRVAVALAQAVKAAMGTKETTSLTQSLRKREQE